MPHNTVEARLRELGVTLPDPGPPGGGYVTAVTTGQFVHLSGHGPLVEGAPTALGSVPSEVDLDAARAAARLTAVNLIATLRDHLGDLERVERLVKLMGYVRADAGFEDHARVTDGASELLASAFGPERGSHVRSTVGVSSLPFGLCVELDLVAYVRRS